MQERALELISLAPEKASGEAAASALSRLDSQPDSRASRPQAAGSRNTTARKATKATPKPKTLKGAPLDLMAALRELVDASETPGISPDQLAVLSKRWILDRRYTRGLAEGTLQGYEFTATRLVWFLDAHGYQECGEEELLAFFEYCRDGRDADGGRWGHQCTGRHARSAHMGQRAICIQYNNLRAFFGWMVKKGHLMRSPFERMEPPKERQIEIIPFREEHILALIEAAKKSVFPKRNVAILLVLFDCGLRANELCTLLVRDVDFEERTIKVRHGKGGKERTVIFSPLTAAALWNYLDEAPRHPDDSLFISQRGIGHGRGLTPRGLHLLFMRLGQAAGIDDVRCSPHTMRHAFASSYLMRGGSLEDLRRSLGHTTTWMSQRYVHLNQEYMREQHRRFSPVEGLLKKRK